MNNNDVPMLIDDESEPMIISSSRKSENISRSRSREKRSRNSEYVSRSRAKRTRREQSVPPPPQIENVLSNVNDSKTPESTTNNYNFKKSKTPDSKKKIENFIKQNRSRKIQRFFKKTEKRRKELFLKSICSDSGVCIAFGTESKKIKEFFDNFAHFKYLNSHKRIGTTSQNANGVVYEIEYKRDDYLAHTVLKTSVAKTTDNLVYEYLVGKFINTHYNKYPCFLETYQLFIHSEYENLKDPMNHLNTIRQVKSKLDINMLLELSCVFGPAFALLIQHIKSAKTLYDVLISGQKLNFIDKELPYILAQVYIPLYNMRKIFTHYDLHLQNVLLYEPIKGSYIQYYYHMPDGKIHKFKSRYIAKIIDYGRCYFDEQPGNSSKDIFRKVCSLAKCSPKCGNDLGYKSLNFQIPFSTIHKNESADLRLLYAMGRFMMKNSILYELVAKVVYGVGLNPEYKQYGTMENLNEGYPFTINNVSDACKSLCDIISYPFYVDLNDAHYLNMDRIGDLHVYLDGRPMDFIPKSKLNTMKEDDTLSY